MPYSHLRFGGQLLQSLSRTLKEYFPEGQCEQLTTKILFFLIRGYLNIKGLNNSPIKHILKLATKEKIKFSYFSEPDSKIDEFLLYLLNELAVKKIKTFDSE